MGVRVVELSIRLQNEKIGSDIFEDLPASNTYPKQRVTSFTAS